MRIAFLILGFQISKMRSATDVRSFQPLWANRRGLVRYPIIPVKIVPPRDVLLRFADIELGEWTGPTSALDICSPGQSLPKHFLIPSHRKSLSDEDRDFLRRKGVFKLPGKRACDSMIEAYLLNVHPILPVVEADVLLQYHAAGRLQNYNILLLWSLFFVGVNVCHQSNFMTCVELIQRYSISPQASARRNVSHQKGQ
jgi:hypothetical protein